MITELPQTNGNIRFPSLTAVKTANNDLLKRRSNVDDPEAFLTDVAAFIQKGVATGAILNVESDRWTCQSIVDYWTNFLDRYDHDTAPNDALLVPFDEKLAIDIPESKCPYVGLEAFRESKQQLFFGRERLITELLQKVSTSRCLAIIGSSGSGKSSLVLAGVVPALKAGAYDRSKQWQYLPTIVPGVDPLASLVSLIPRPADVREEEWVAEQVRGLMQSNSHLCELINRNNFEAAFIVVDQFEELFTLTLDETVQKAFIANLLSLAEYPDLRHTLILTMRSEFESYIAKSPELAKYFAQGVRITPLTAAEVREAIQKPAELVGLKFEDGIVDELVNETIGEPAGLPLLQFTLLKLWKMRQHDLVTREAFRKLGSCREALTRSADEFYNSLIPIDQSRVREIMLKLVRPGPGGGFEVFNNRVPRTSLYKSPEEAPHIKRLLKGLLEAGLIRETEGDAPGKSTIEVAHEALVRHWRMLVGWLDEERVTLKRRPGLREAATRWDVSKRDSLNLLRGAQLDEALTFDDLSPLEEEFVKRSQQRRVWKKRLSYIGLGAGIIGLSVLAIVFRYNAKESAEKERKALSQALAAKSLLAKDRLDLALLLSVEAYSTAHTTEARNSLFTLLFGDPASKQITYLKPPPKPARAISLNNDSMMTSINTDGTISVWNLQKPELQPTTRHTGIASAAARTLSADGNVAAISTYEGEIIILDSGTGKQKQVISVRPPGSNRFEYAYDLHLSGNGKILAARSDLGTNVRVWEIESGKMLGVIDTGATALALTHDGTLLAFFEWGADRITVWDVYKNKAGNSIDLQVRIENPFIHLVISPDGKYVAWSNENIVFVRPTGGKEPEKKISSQGDNITDLFFSADGKKLISTSEDGIITISKFGEAEEHSWPDEYSSVLVNAPADAISAVALSGDEKTLVASTQKGAVILWNLDKESRLTRKLETTEPTYQSGTTETSFRSVAITSDDHTVAAGTDNGSILFWDVPAKKQLKRQFVAPVNNERAAEQAVQDIDEPGSQGLRVDRLMFSADNKVLAAEYSDGRDILWDMDTGAPMFLPIVEEEAVIALSLSSDNKTVAWISAARNANLPSSNSAGSDVSKERNLVLWRFRTNDPPQVLIQKGVQSLTGVAFSNDGKLLATSDKDGNATLWDVKTGNKTADLQNAQSQRSRLRRLSLAFSPDDRMLIVANPAFGLTFWNLITGQVFDDPITDNTRRVSKMSFSSGKDGPIMASSGFGSRIVLWDLNTRQPLGVITPPFSTDHSLSHNGTFLLVSGKELVYWDVSVEAWLTVACQIANRDLTEPEWKNYVGNEASFRKTCTR